MKNQKSSKKSKKPERRYGEGQSYKSDGMDRDKTRPEREDYKGRTKGSNDAGWYQVESQLMKDAAQLSFPVTAGRAINVEGWGVKTDIRMPGIMSFGVLPTYGEMTDWNSPFNVAIRKTYSWIRHANSGHSNYDAADLGQYFIAYDSACTFYAWMVRCYGLARTLIVQNAYTPADLVAACGCDYEDLIQNLAQFRAFINTYAVRLQALKVPSDLHFMERHMWLFTHVYADAPLAKCSFFLFNPVSIWEHRITATDDEMVLSSKVFSTIGKVSAVGGATYSSIVECANEILNGILNNEDFNIMSGDIIKAYGDKVFTLNLITEDYQVTPVYDPEVLLQIRNATLPGFSSTEVQTVIRNSVTKDATKLCSIRENKEEGQLAGATQFTFKMPASILQLPTSEENDAVLACKCTTVANRVLTLPVANPSPAEVCVATRLAAQWAITGAEDYSNSVTTVKTSMLVPDAFGTELILTMSYLTSPGTGWHAMGDNATTPTVADTIKLMTMMEKFDWAPSLVAGAIKWIRDNTTTPKQFSIVGVQVTDISGDWDNTTCVSRSTLHNIHRAAVMGMFDLAL